MSAGWTVVRAAAGCGKTTDLAVRWLGHLAEGLAPEQIVAITFTRRAAAELGERVALALRACIDDERGREARRRLGAAAPLYAEAAPRDPAVARRALEQLPDAPIGTTDAFVQRLLTEFAVHAAVRLPDGRRIPLDLPIMPGTGARASLERAARRVLDPPDGTVDPDVATLASAWSFDELLPALSQIGRWDDLPLVSTSEVLGRWTDDLARVLARIDVAGLSGVGGDRDEAAWAAALAPQTNESGQWAVEAAARWFAGGARPEIAPWTLFGWVGGLSLVRKLGKTVQSELSREVRDTGPGRLDLWQLVVALRYPYDDPAMVRRADALREARERVRRRVLAAGLRDAALAGDLSHDELLEAATGLVREPPPRLLGRFRALLVDEIQDANPQQLAFYRALAGLPDTSAYFVGDSRQSIYLFRDAEPEGLRELEREVNEGRGTGRDLVRNHRSAPRLVAAHRALFDRLAEPMRAQRWRPVDDLALLEAEPSNAALALVPTADVPDDPVWIVVPKDQGRIWDDELDDRALTAFLERLDRAVAEPGHATDTAVVLTPSWAVARRACERIRAWRGRPDAAFVEGAGRGAITRVTEDLALFLRALSDDEDDVAWLGVWKHPAVGLSDAALARASAGVGLLTRTERGPTPFTPLGGRLRLGRLVQRDALGPPHDEADVTAFARARPALQEARDRLGRTATSTVLEQLFDALDWRVILRSGPGGEDDLAELAVLLDWIRDRDQEGLAPDAIGAALLDDRTERPVVHVDRPVGHVACTTVFQAKGLAWDHVCVLRIGQAPGGSRATGEAQGWMTFGERRVRLAGLHFDPRGGLSPFRDPLSRLAGRLARLRGTEECARLAYVAVTRARRSVTFALTRKRKAGARKDLELRDLLPDAWVSTPLPDVAVVERGAPPAPPAPPPRRVVPSGARLPERPEPGPRWNERAPSSLGAHVDAEARRRMADWVATRVRLVNGLHRGGNPTAPPGTDPRTGLPLPGARLGHLGPTDWGRVAHGWLAAWRFSGPPDDERISAYLADEWGAPDDEVRGWLSAISHNLAIHGGPLWKLVTAEGARLHFEYPMLGLARADDADGLLSGRIDLLVDHGKRCSVVDFKAGARSPTGWHDLADGASLKTYAFQLHAYADALRRTGRTVDTVALWFVRDGTSVRWTP